jgi:hypothetical protein
MNSKEANKHFPLWRVDFQEYVYGKDSGNEWDDPENDIRKKGKILYYCKKDFYSEWQEEYSEWFNSFDYALHQASITLHRLQSIMPPENDVVMFEYHDKMFTFEYWFEDQKCVCGESIDDFYNEYEDDNNVKVDIVQSYVFFYAKDCLVIKNGNLYLNGELVMKKQDLKEKHDIDKHSVEMMYPSSVQKKIKELFPQAKTYSSWCAGGVL